MIEIKGMQTVITKLETSGANTAYPFNTRIAGVVTIATLSPLDTSFPFDNATDVGALATAYDIETITVPTTTMVTVVVTTTAYTTTVIVTRTVSGYATLSYATTVAGSVSTISTTSAVNSTYTTSSVITTSGTVASTSTSVQATTSVVSGITSESASNCTDTLGCNGTDIFVPVALTDVPSNFERRSDHPVAKLGIENQTIPTETNKFYSNFFLGDQLDATFTHPYSLAWSAGSGNAESYGMAISHVDDDQKVYGAVRTDIPGSPASYYINPLAIQSIILSATEFGNSTVLTSDTLLGFSANINLQPESGSASKITFPVVQGMGFVTGIYTDLQPVIQSSVFFRTVTAAGTVGTGIYKYRITLEDGKFWLLYITPSDGVDPNLQLQSSTLLEGMSGFSGTIQVAKNPGNASESIYDEAAGVYATGATISGYASGSVGSYSFAWTKGGTTYTTLGKRDSNSTTDSTLDSSLLMFALPHHVQSMDTTTKAKVTTLQLNTTTKGVATALLADSWTLEEANMPTGMGFAPWRPNSGSVTNLSSAAIATINEVAAVEISQNMTAQSDLDSMYYSGKALSKFAQLVWTVYELGQNDGLAAAGLANLKAAFAVFVNQQQPYPLVYDEVWGGVVSSASYVTGDSGYDYGNTYYNDHHFHYGYHIHAAAVIGALDPTWLTNNSDYVNALVRDVSNPSLEDSYFPFFRSFDWYHGHSWAKGLFESGDSKDQESTSEDAMFAYALKLWGNTIGDASMEARGNLMLSVATRSFQNYFLMESTNINQPANFIDNKVTGILFENKVDHTTYFGTNLEYIEG
ncbi:putative endo-beta-glucanase engl1 [Phaeomoniella chlamydospora]|uniref:glucan endo-1,3-beta-D-glucosidase n=1 Tax=Phaeomoniella chlamydospora TaxID=158046 RepID=A0A0G2F276_PHACM|nr:putative endo-beta-glucanase engl1 [Phaeomoniella chlamydospora]